MWFRRRLLRISWTDKVTNETVLHKANIDRRLLNDIVNRQMRFFGYVVRKEELKNLFETGFVEGKRTQERQWESYLTYLQKRKYLTPMELIHFAFDRDVWLSYQNSSLCPNDTAHDADN